MGKQVSRIEKEFIFKKILERNSLVRILSKKKEIEGKIIKFNNDFLVIDCLENDISYLKARDEVSIFFIFENSQHTFTTKITEIKEKQLIISQPEIAYKNLMRQYERIRSTEDIHVSFNIKGKKIQLDFPKTDNYFPFVKPEYSEDFEPSSFQSLVSTFRRKMKRIVSVNKIIMLRNRMPSTYEEEILAKIGKIIWIPSTEEGFLIKSDYPELDLLLYKDLYNYERESGTPLSEIGKKIENTLQEKIEKGYYSQLYYPILYHEYLVGYIYVCNFWAKKNEINIGILNYIDEFSRVLCHSLERNHYFKEKEIDSVSYMTPLLDISGSGLLFSYPEKYLSVELSLHSVLIITLKIGKRKMEIESMVIRKYKDKNTYYFALKFIKMTPEDFRFLFEHIYGKPYSEKSKPIWESEYIEINENFDFL